MPAKRKANALDPVKPVKAAKPPAADFGSAFTTISATPLLAAPTKAPAPKSVAPKSTPKQPIVKKSHRKNAPSSSDDENAGISAVSTAFASAKKAASEKRRGRGAENSTQSQQPIKSSTNTSTVSAVVTADIDPTEELRAKQRRLQKIREKENKLLLEKDHVVPEFNDIEKRFVRIATKGVVTLFNAVNEQQRKLDDIRSTSALLTPNQQKELLHEESRDGFLDLLKQSVEQQGGTDGQEQTQHRGNAKLRDLYKQENVEQDDDDDSDDDDEDQHVDTRNNAQKGDKKGRTVAHKLAAEQQSTWSILEDDYLTSQSRKLKDWGKDSDSDTDSDL